MDSVIVAAASAEPARPQPKPTLDLIEFEMALDSAHSAANGFISSVEEAALALGGTFLFDLPASGLIDDCQKIAAIHLPVTDEGYIILALLSEDGRTIRAEAPSEATADLANFARAYIALQASL